MALFCYISRKLTMKDFIMEENKKPNITAMGLIMSNGQTTLRDTNLMKLKIKITGTSDSKEFADVLANDYGVDHANSSVPVGSMKVDMRNEYDVFAKIEFGTELEGISSFDVQILAATFVHTIKKVSGGVDDSMVCNIDCIKNYDDADPDITFWTKRKECRGGKKSFIPLKFKFFALNNNPVQFTPIEVDRDEGEDDDDSPEPVVVQIPDND